MTTNSVAAIIGTGSHPIAACQSRPRPDRSAQCSVAHASASGPAMMTRNASTNGPTSMTVATSGPTNSQRYTGSSSNWATIRAGVVAVTCSASPPASSVNVMT
jgi:hypothetical protein